MATCNHEPVYRPILREAFAFSWKEKKLWLVSFFAGLTLTGSVYDVLWRGMNALAPEASIVGFLAPFWIRATETWPGLTAGELILGSLNVLLITAFLLLIAFTFYAGSVISQSTLVYSVGARRRGKIPMFKDALTVGARAVWPVLALNIMALVILTATRGLAAIGIAIVGDQPAIWSYLLYMLGFILFIGIGALTVIVQIFALNAMILQGSTLAQGIVRGYEVVRRHWITVAETAALLFVISVGAYVLSVMAGLLLSVPYVILLFVAFVLKSAFLFTAITVVFILIFIALMIAVFGFTVQLHYATWTLMYRKLGEGGILPKLHRMARQFIHTGRINV